MFSNHSKCIINGSGAFRNDLQWLEMISGCLHFRSILHQSGPFESISNSAKSISNPFHVKFFGCQHFWECGNVNQLGSTLNNLHHLNIHLISSGHTFDNIYAVDLNVVDNISGRMWEFLVKPGHMAANLFGNIWELHGRMWEYLRTSDNTW